VKPTRTAAVAIALLGAALATAGCGIGPGEEVGETSLTVTRDYGAERIAGPVREPVSESDTVMRLLDREAEISTRYGGGFVSAIEGVSEAVRDGRRYDWFFYVNGVESPIGAADFQLEGGEAVWWDYRDWAAASRVPAVVGSWPHPLVGGYEGRERPVALECFAAAACAVAERKMRHADARARIYRRYSTPNADSTAKVGAVDGAIRVLVGPWARLRSDPAAAQIERGPGVSGVFAQFVARGGGFELRGLDEEGELARTFGPAAGLVAATSRFGGPPVWLVSGPTARGALAAAGTLDIAHLRDRYAVATEGGEETPLPLGASTSR
jgi:Domain of unknown function (DUF4430)